MRQKKVVVMLFILAVLCSVCGRTDVDYSQENGHILVKNFLRAES